MRRQSRSPPPRDRRSAKAGSGYASRRLARDALSRSCMPVSTRRRAAHCRDLNAVVAKHASTPQSGGEIGHKKPSMNSLSQKENFNKKSTPTVSEKRPLEVGRPEPGAVATCQASARAEQASEGPERSKGGAPSRLDGEYTTGTRPGGLAARTHDGCNPFSSLSGHPPCFATARSGFIESKLVIKGSRRQELISRRPIERNGAIP
jgi:hypothetical protein